MAEESQEQRTEQPTQRKREKAREKGRVAKSHELTSALLLVGAIVTLRLLLPWMIKTICGLSIFYFESIPLAETPEAVGLLLNSTLIKTLALLAPYFLAVVGLAIAGNYLQIGFLFSTDPLVPSFDKIDPISGFRRLFSLRSLVVTGINIGKAALIGLVFYYSVKAGLRNYYVLGDCDASASFGFVIDEIFTACLKAGLILLIIGLADYSYQRFQHTRSLMMTKQEVKEEYKELEGSPLIKSRVRAAQRALARRRMMSAVPTADVVVTNPVHIAVALKYDSETMQAPIVVAKGKRLLAEKIKEIARKHGVPIFENKTLAHSLYELVDVGREIPESLYRAVAEVLSYVYRLKNKLDSIVTER